MKNSSTSQTKYQVDLKINRRPKVIFDIKRANKPYLVLFYTLAWGLNPQIFGLKKTKKANKQMLVDLAQEFRKSAKKAKVTVGQISIVQFYDLCQRFGERNVPGYELAIKLYHLYWQVPSQYHNIYIPVVKAAILQFEKNDLETALKIINGPALGGILL